MFIEYKTFVALLFAVMTALLGVVTGCMKMDATTTEPVLNIVEGDFDTPLSIPHMKIAKQVFMGLAGRLIVNDPLQLAF